MLIVGPSIFVALLQNNDFPKHVGVNLELH
jgi:hypothetical protein